MAKKNSPSKEHLKFLKDVLATNQIDLQFEISLCLSDIPKSHIQKAKNGKLYLDIVASPRKEPDQWGRDIKVSIKPTQKEREEKTPKIYVGGGRMITFATDGNQQASQQDMDENLPFPLP